MDEARVSRVFRVVGALFLLVSASTFLVTTWPQQSDLVRYLVLGAHIAGLFVGALYCGTRLKDGKTARVLLWTATAIVPILLAALGGLVYSQFSLDPFSENLPQIATWIAPNAWSASIAVVVSLPLVFAVVRSTARVLSPRLARVWSWIFLAQCLLFLVPLRASGPAGLLVFAGVVGPALFELGVFGRTEAARNIEGRMLRGLLWIAPSMIGLRTIIFYSPDATFGGLVLSVLGWFSFLLVSRSEWSPKWKTALELACATFATIGIFVISDILVPNYLGDLDFLLPVSSAIFMGHLTRSSGRWLSALALTMTVIGSVFILGESPSSLECAGFFAFFAGVTISNVFFQRPVQAITTSAIGLGSLLALFDCLVGFDDVQVWHLLSGLGVLSFVLSILFEKQLPRMTRWLKSSPA